jgi:hypothetical protein
MHTLLSKRQERKQKRLRCGLRHGALERLLAVTGKRFGDCIALREVVGAGGPALRQTLLAPQPCCPLPNSIQPAACGGPTPSSGCALPPRGTCACRCHSPEQAKHVSLHRTRPLPRLPT